ncbi:MAG: CARDB domain-containing protein, partial [Candidatus Thermoplasmatota archaeon]|nr:CARDB domain-containing protein [Candidatus Thermoplasmatota archaeon]
MSGPQGRWALGLVLLFVFVSMHPVIDATGSRAAVDVTPSTFTTSYASTADATLYDSLSRSTSNFNRPVDLWIIDGMLGVQHTLTVGVENLGTSSASNVAVEIVVLHDEYDVFELFNTTVYVSSINAQSTQSISTTWIPTYSGNHTVRVTTNHASDTNPSNDIGYSTITIGFLYERCESSSTWSRTSNWRIDADNRLNGVSSCRIGGTTSTSNYGNMWTETLRSPTLDLSDAHQNPTNGYGLGFFYTGNVAQGDTLQVRVSSGSNVANLFSNGGLTGEVSGQPSSWLIQVSTVNGRGVPWLEIPPSVLGPQSTIEFIFTSDSTGTEIGYWVEDIVMFYDQKASASEFGLDLQGSPSSTSARGEWSDMGFSVRNTGNITDKFTLEANGLPAEWDYRFTHPSGSGLLSGTEITILPGESRNFRLQTKPPESASTGSIQGNIIVQSVQENTASDSLSFSAGVAPRYESQWSSISSSPKCSPGSVCSHSMVLENTGDGSDTFIISVDEISVPSGWAFGVSSTQESSITLEPSQTEVVDFTMAIPSDALPGETAVVSIVSSSQADSTSEVRQQLTIEASMISDIRIVESWDFLETHILPGESIELEWEIHNDAGRLDQIEFNWTLEGAQTWTVSLSGPSTASIAGGSHSTMRVSLHAPSDGHAGDPAPIITPIITSTKSSITFTGESVTGPRIAQVHSLSMDIPTDNFVAFLPEQPSPIHFTVKNNGNGVDRVKISVDGLPDGWTTNMLVDGEVSDSTFEIDLA